MLVESENLLPPHLRGTRLMKREVSLFLGWLNLYLYTNEFAKPNESAAPIGVKYPYPITLYHSADVEGAKIPKRTTGAPLHSAVLAPPCPTVSG